MDRASFLCFDAMLTFDDAEAINKFHKAKDIYLGLEPCDTVCRALANIFDRLGNFEKDFENYEEATEYYHQSAEYYERTVQLKPDPDTYCYFAEVCVKLNDSRGPDLFTKAIELGSKRACLYYGWFLHQKKEFNAAHNYYRLALEDDEELSTYLRAEIVFKIGLIYHERFINLHIQSHYEAAEKKYKDAINMMVKGQKDALVFLPILREGLIAHFWIEYERLTL
uniref:Tetratricopeptide repeat protein n=1 Tax=viral metagenome TaxID=1070528 RepID=A0A6C0D191_9ZZZZ